MEVYVKLLNPHEESMEMRPVRVDSIGEEEQTCAFDQIYEAIGAEFGLETGTYSLLSHSGSKLMPWSNIERGHRIQVCPVVLGGKGGFGSLLRAFGKQITMSTNKDACRDLTGRRLKQVNNEKKMREFLEKQTELAKKKEEAKLEKRKRRRKKLEKIEESSTGLHMFVDPKYDEQKQKIAQELEEALDRGMTAKKQDQPTTSSGGKKSPSSDETAPSTSSAAAAISEKEEAKIVVPPPMVIEEKRDKKKEETASSAAAKKKDIDSKLIDWMGVGGVDVDVSSSSSDEEQPEPAKKLKKN